MRKDERKTKEQVVDELPDLRWSVADPESTGSTQGHLQEAQYAERLRVLYAIDGVLLASWMPEQIAKVALRHLQQLVPCCTAEVCTFDFENQKIMSLALCTNGEFKVQAGVYPLPDDPVGINTLQMGKVLTERDELSATGSLVMYGSQTTHVRSYVAIPLLVQGALVGTLVLTANTPSAFAPKHIEIAREVAEHVALSLQQARLRTALEVEKRRLETVVKHLPEGVLLLDDKRRIVLINPAAESCLAVLTGVEADNTLTNLGGQPLEGLMQLEGTWHELEVTEPHQQIFEAAVHPVDPVNGETTGQWVLLIRDVTTGQEASLHTREAR